MNRHDLVGQRVAVTLGSGGRVQYLARGIAVLEESKNDWIKLRWLDEPDGALVPSLDPSGWIHMAVVAKLQLASDDDVAAVAASRVRLQEHFARSGREVLVRLWWRYLLSMGVSTVLFAVWFGTAVAIALVVLWVLGLGIGVVVTWDEHRHVRRRPWNRRA
jgi:hypothetical protein